MKGVETRLQPFAGIEIVSKEYCVSFFLRIPKRNEMDFFLVSSLSAGK